MCRWNSIFTNSDLLDEPVDTDDFIPRLVNSTRFEWFRNQNSEWNHRSVEFSEVLAQFGKCFNVNMLKNVYNYEMFVICAIIPILVLIEYVSVFRQIFNQIKPFS